MPPKEDSSKKWIQQWILEDETLGELSSLVKENRNRAVEYLKALSSTRAPGLEFALPYHTEEWDVYKWWTQLLGDPTCYLGRSKEENPLRIYHVSPSTPWMLILKFWRELAAQKTKSPATIAIMRFIQGFEESSRLLIKRGCYTWKEIILLQYKALPPVARHIVLTGPLLAILVSADDFDPFYEMSAGEIQKVFFASFHNLVAKYTKITTLDAEMSNIAAEEAQPAIAEYITACKAISKDDTPTGIFNRWRHPTVVALKSKAVTVKRALFCLIHRLPDFLAWQIASDVKTDKDHITTQAEIYELFASIFKIISVYVPDEQVALVIAKIKSGKIQKGPAEESHAHVRRALSGLQFDPDDHSITYVDNAVRPALEGLPRPKYNGLPFIHALWPHLAVLQKAGIISACTRCYVVLLFIPPPVRHVLYEVLDDSTRKWLSGSSENVDAEAAATPAYIELFYRSAIYTLEHYWPHEHFRDIESVVRKAKLMWWSEYNPERFQTTDYHLLTRVPQRPLPIVPCDFCGEESHEMYECPIFEDYRMMGFTHPDAYAAQVEFVDEYDETHEFVLDADSSCIRKSPQFVAFLTRVYSGQIRRKSAAPEA